MIRSGLAGLAIALPLFPQSGRVITESGDPPSKAFVERVCGGRVETRIDIDREGYFRFPNDPLPGCVVRAVAGSARSVDVDLKRVPGREIGTLIVHPPRSVPRNVISVKALGTPEAAKKEFSKASKAAQRSKWEEAAQRLEKATSIYPDFGAAWMQLGLVRERQGDKTGAADAYSRAIKAEPKMVQAHMRLLILAVEREDWASVSDISARVIAIRPRRFGMAYLYNAQANILLGRPQPASESLRIARELDPSRRVGRLELLEGALMEQNGDNIAAVAAYRRYLAYGPLGDEGDQLRRRIERLEEATK